MEHTGYDYFNKNAYSTLSNAYKTEIIYENKSHKEKNKTKIPVIQPKYYFDLPKSIKP